MAAVVALERAAYGTRSRAVLEFLAGAPKQLLINGEMGSGEVWKNI